MSKMRYFSNKFLKIV